MTIPTHDNAQIAYTRRSALAAGAAIAGTAGTGILAGPAFATGVTGSVPPPAFRCPLVTPMSSQRVQQNWGVCDHPNFPGGYENRPAVIGRLAGMRIAYIRGMYTSDAMGAGTTAQLRANGMKWVMTVFPTEHGMTTAALVARIKHIGNNSADVCKAIEGPNEWNNSRAGGAPMTAAATVAIQKTIYQTVRADPRLNHVEVLGPAAHAIVLDNHAGRDYLDLVRAGIKPYQDAQAVHSYAAAAEITTKLDTRLAFVYAAFGDNYPVQLTETGWTTGGTTGQPQNTEADAATYSAQAVLIMAACKIPTMRYETLDDSPMGGRDGFGLWSCTSHTDTSKWRAKPEVAAVGNLLRALRDPGPAYTVPLIRVQIVGNVQSGSPANATGHNRLALGQRRQPRPGQRDRQPGQPHLPGHQTPDPGAPAPRLRPADVSVGALYSPAETRHATGSSGGRGTRPTSLAKSEKTGQPGRCYLPLRIRGTELYFDLRSGGVSLSQRGPETP